MADINSTVCNDNDTFNGPFAFHPKLIDTLSNDIIDGLAGNEMLESLGGNDRYFVDSIGDLINEDGLIAVVEGRLFGLSFTSDNFSYL